MSGNFRNKKGRNSIRFRRGTAKGFRTRTRARLRTRLRARFRARENKAVRLIKMLKDDGRMEELAKCLEDSVYRQQLYHEYEIK